MQAPASAAFADWMKSARAFVASGQTLPLDFRRGQLRRLADMIAARESVWIDALAADLGKPASESRMAEIGWVLNDVRHALRNLASWSRASKRRSPLGLRPGRSYVQPQPRGVVLILAPWNYPLQLLFSPLVAAVAAGNAACVKPSELAPAVSRAVAQALRETFPCAYLTAVEGEAATAAALLEQRFDHIFFTGSLAVGRRVMAAAARWPTPVTLELGGKSPCLVCADTDPRIAARRIAWGKFMNAGQTCVAPDYVLVESAVRDALLAELQSAVTAFYGSDPSRSPDYGRIVNARHFERLQALLDAGECVCGGTGDAATRYLSPTILKDPPLDCPVMQEEIFGPVLPVLSVADVDEALGIIRSRPAPLALYLFTERRRTRTRVLAETRSGGVCINDTLMQVFNRALPFGGVGESGLGVYHGKAGFDALSHAKPVVERRLRPDVAARYPPVSLAPQWMDRVNRWLFG